MTDESNVEPARKRRLDRAALSLHAADRPAVAGERHEREADGDKEGRQDADAARSALPPGHQDDPGDDAAHLRDDRQPPGGAFDKERGVRYREEQRQRPEGRRCHGSQGDEEQQAQAEEQDHSTAPRRLERT